MHHKVSVPIQLEDEELFPIYATPAASGADAKASILEPVIVQPGCSAIIPTGLKLELPVGFEIQVRPRSGFAAKNQVTVLNTPGTIDNDYRGEICVILINHGKDPFVVSPKMFVFRNESTALFQALRSSCVSSRHFFDSWANMERT